MFQVGDLVVIINDVNNYIYKIKNIDEKIKVNAKKPFIWGFCL